MASEIPPLLAHEWEDMEPERREGRKNPFVSLEQLEADCQGDENLHELFEAMVHACLRYAETVCEFKQIILQGLDTAEERRLIEDRRTRVHDATIASINIFGRQLRRAGGNVEWLASLRQSGLEDRSKYAAFAIGSAFELLLQSTKPEEVHV